MKNVLPIVYWALLGLQTVALTLFMVIVQPTSSNSIIIWLGWGALISMIVMLVYSVARRSRSLRKGMRLSSWLHFHIFLGMQGVLWSVFHALPIVHKSHINWLNPGMLNLMAVLAIFASGIFGRYLYSWLPRTLAGEQMSLRQTDDELGTADITPERRAWLERRVKILDKANRFFRVWIVLHRPLAAVMYVLSVVHILLAYMFSPALS